MYYFNEETIEYFVTRVKEVNNVEDVKTEMFNFVDQVTPTSPVMLEYL